MWPASKVVPKELFPLGRLPTIAHLVSEFVAAGIRRIILVVAKQNMQLMRGVFDRSVRPPSKLADDPLIRAFENTLDVAELTFLEQSGNYGNATPLIIAAEEVRGQPCIYAFGDDVIFGENATEALLSVYERTGRPVLGAQEIDPAKRSSFGILECFDEEGILYIRRLVEKPGPGVTESNLASFGRYLVTPDLLETLITIRPGKDGEIWFVDGVIQQIAVGKKVCARALSTGTWYTVGDPQSYAKAVRAATDISG
jgi:UTP--glucose-1-phosphate uridylyltransferase